MIGQVIGGYRVLELVGQGSNGTVWKAEHTELKSLAAIKFLPPDLTLKSADRQRFIRGARAVARLHHPSIASVFAADFSGEALYIISEFIAGQTVNALAAMGPLPADRAVEITLQAARALKYAHKEGVIHRDISGGNIMVTPEGRAKIVDFGMAVERDETRMTTQGTVLGTVPYMAPETLRGDSVDESRDTYALGVILYQLLTGRLPFRADTTEVLVYLILTKHAKPPSSYVPRLAAPLDRVVLHALDKSPKLRCTLERLIAVLETLQASGKLQESDQTRRMDSSLGAGLGAALWRLRRRLATLAPTHARKLVMAVGMSLIAVGLLVLGWKITREMPHGPVRPKVSSLAILPFFNESPDRGFEYIGHGLAEHLAERLGGLEGLLVQPYRRALSGDAEELGTKLNVEGMLEGSFSIHGGTVKTRVDLVRRSGKRETICRNTSQGYRLAAEDLAESVARGLKSRLTIDEAAHVATRAAASNEAFDALSTAVTAFNSDPNEALRWYERAASLDPGLAKAYVGIGSIHYERYFRGEGGEADLEIAKSNFRQALALDPDNGGAEGGLTLVYTERGDRDSVLAIVKRASVNPSVMNRLLIPARAYTLGSWPELAVPLLERAVEVDPLNEEALYFLVLASEWSGQYEKTIRAGGEFLRRFGEEPDMLQLVGFAHWELGRGPLAGTYIQRGFDLIGNTRVFAAHQTGDYFLDMGDKVKARKIWSGAREIAEDRLYTAPGNLKMHGALCGLYVRLGHKQKALSEIATMDSLLVAGVSQDGLWDLWIPAAYEVHQLRSTVVRFLQDHFRATEGFLTGASIAGPELGPLVATARAHDDSLRQRYGLPARKKGMGVRLPPRREQKPA